MSAKWVSTGIHKIPTFHWVQVGIRDNYRLTGKAWQKVSASEVHREFFIYWDGLHSTSISQVIIETNSLVEVLRWGLLPYTGKMFFQIR